jgi:hypothetical protein
VFVPVKQYIKNMKHGEKMLICTLAGLALCAVANAVTSESSGSPYLGIVERNVFGLKPPPPPPDPEANKPPPPKIFLQGITTFGGVKRALFKAQMPPKPGEPPKGEQSFILAEGQRDGDMEVVAIDANSPGSVKVSAFGTITTLDFEHNGIKTTAAAPVPGAAPRPSMGVPPPGAPGANPFTPGGGAQPFPTTRPMRMPLPNGTAGSPGAYGGTAATYNAVPAGATTSGGVTLPGFTTGTTPTQTAAQQQQQPPLSGELQAAMLAAQQLANKNNRYPPAPPPIMQLFGEEDNSGSATPVPSLPQLPRAPSLPPLRPQ